MSSEFNIEEELAKLPKSPGVYIMHDAGDEIIYVGKAVNLRNRVRQYFRNLSAHSPKVKRMVSRIERFEYIVTDSELEALVLESNLIKENRPRYNTMLKDDKTYPYVRVSLAEEFPRITLVRGMKKDGSKYYGPYPTSGAVRDTIDQISKLFMIRTCARALPDKKGAQRPCLDYHIGRCGAPCAGLVSPEEYRKNVMRAVEFLDGNTRPEIDRLRALMEEASRDMRFEEAASIRDLIESINITAERQKITSGDGDDRDVIGAAVSSEIEGEEGRHDTEAVVQVFFIRGGKLIGREHFYLRAGNDEDKAQVLTSFISQYYSGTPFIPKELMISLEIPDRELLEEWLSKRRGSKVSILTPKRGVKEKLVEMAEENAAGALARDRDRLRREELRTRGAVREIGELLGLDYPSRMEAFDISNISGYEAVGSMVVYADGKPKRTDYRKFRIKTVEGPNDYASMEEVLTRRFRRAASGDAGFEALPDLILMDGGRGQVSSALKVLNELGFDIPVAGMVKDDAHRTRALWFEGREVPCDTRSEAFHLITRIQDEAHRFAIEYHRLLRSKGQVRSVLDDIPGIGGARRKALMKAFPSIEAIKNATAEELAKVPSMNAAAAEAVERFFKERGRADANDSAAVTSGGGDASQESDSVDRHD